MQEDRVMTPDMAASGNVKDESPEEENAIMSLKSKKSHSNDRMPRIEQAYESEDNSRYKEHRT